MPIKVYSSRERLDIIERALELRYNKRFNWEEISDTLDVARSTLNEWRKADDWKEADQRWRRMLRDAARGDSAQMLQDAIDVIYDLMKTDRSGYVRFMAASKIIDLNQVGNEIEEAAADQQKELNDFLLKAARHRVQQLEPVRPGGLLPETIDEANQEYKQRKQNESKAIEAEFRQINDLSLDDERDKLGEKK